MELIKTIALLCQMQWAPINQVQCHKYFIKCVEAVNKNYRKVLEEKPKPEDALKICIKQAQVGVKGNLF